MRYAVASALLLAVSLPAWSENGLVTWLHPQKDGRSAAEAAQTEVRVSVRTAEGVEVTDAASLKAAGDVKFLISVTGFPAGTYPVFLRYFPQPRLLLRC